MSYIKSTFILTVSILFSSLVLFSCNEDDETLSSTPSNLEVAVTVSEDGSGLITITANADNADHYFFYSGEVESDTVLNEIGEFEHTYLLTGLYEIDVRAYGADGRFLKESKNISVQVGEDTGPINADDGYVTPLSYEGMKLIWQDEFSGNSLSSANWNYETGRGSNGWGNNELQYYKQQNTRVSNGYLTIEARRENESGAQFTSSRLTTQNKFNFRYGRVDIRAKMPKGQGIWPALWMLGKNITSVSWPRCGEIDIMEMIGGGDGRDNTVHGTIHWDNDGQKADYGGKKQLSQGNLSDRFHVYSITWDATSIRWFIDDVQYHSATISSAPMSEFREEFFFIVNVAVGGNWPGSPDSSTVFPQQMNVDYIRVFQPE